MNRPLQIVRRVTKLFLRISPVLLLHFVWQANAIGVVAWGAGAILFTNNNNDFGQCIVPAGLTNGAQVAGGWRHSLALKTDGTLEGWGDDSLGQVDFPATNNYLAIACGDLFSMALSTNGTVMAIGDNSFYGESDVPTNLTGVVAIACGFYHGLALEADGTVIAWGGTGSYSYGQGTIPFGLSNIVAIAGGGWHSLALKSDGTIKAWGRDDYGQGAVPAGISNVVAIAAGAAHNLVLKSDGTLFAWGSDFYGETEIPFGLSNVVAIACGGWHNLALKSDGRVVAWGAGGGTNSNVDYGQNLVPAGLSNVVQIAAGKLHSLALVGDAPPITAALVTNFTFGTNGFTLRVPTRNGRVYRLEYKNSLTDTNWSVLPLHAGSGSAIELTDPDTFAPQRFYRVRQW